MSSPLRLMVAPGAAAGPMKGNVDTFGAQPVAAEGIGMWGSVVLTINNLVWPSA